MSEAPKPHKPKPTKKALPTNPVRRDTIEDMIADVVVEPNRKVRLFATDGWSVPVYTPKDKPKGHKCLLCDGAGAIQDANDKYYQCIRCAGSEVDPERPFTTEEQNWYWQIRLRNAGEIQANVLRRTLYGDSTAKQATQTSGKKKHLMMGEPKVVDYNDGDKSGGGNTTFVPPIIDL
jgi:hypothetical protein